MTIPIWFHNAPAAVGVAFIVCVAISLVSMIVEQYRKRREQHSTHVPYVNRAGWGFVDYRGCARRRR
jgi:hypothetical protein